MRCRERVHVVAFSAGRLATMETAAIPGGAALLLEVADIGSGSDRLRVGKRGCVGRIAGRRRQCIQPGVVSERCSETRRTAARVRGVTCVGQLRAGSQGAGLIAAAWRHGATREDCKNQKTPEMSG